MGIDSQTLDFSNLRSKKIKVRSSRATDISHVIDQKVEAHGLRH